MEKYTVGQIAKSLGVSNQTIRHYESLGLIESQRNDDNRYRTYSVSDTRILFMIYIYRSMGFSLPKIKEMLKEMKIDEVKVSFDERLKEINDQIHELELIKLELEEYRNGIDMVSNHDGKFWIMNETHVGVAIMKSGSGKDLIEEGDDLIEYQKLAPHVRQGFVIGSNSFEEPEEFNFKYGVFISEEYARDILSEDILKKYLVTVKGPMAKMILVSHGDAFTRETFKPFIEWIHSQNLEIASDIYGVVRYHAYYEQEITIFEFGVSVI